MGTMIFEVSRRQTAGTTLWRSATAKSKQGTIRKYSGILLLNANKIFSTTDELIDAANHFSLKVLYGMSTRIRVNPLKQRYKQSLAKNIEGVSPIRSDRSTLEINVCYFRSLI